MVLWLFPVEYFALPAKRSTVSQTMSIHAHLVKILKNPNSVLSMRLKLLLAGFFFFAGLTPAVFGQVSPTRLVPEDLYLLAGRSRWWLAPHDVRGIHRRVDGR
jgi:hypothetical protein